MRRLKSVVPSLRCDEFHQLYQVRTPANDAYSEKLGELVQGYLMLDAELV